MPWIIVDTGSKEVPAMLGRNWFNAFELNWSEIIKKGRVQLNTKINGDNELSKIKKEFAKVFNDSGEIKEFKASTVLKPNVTPIFRKAYNVPYAIRQKVEEVC